jgi:Phosphoribosylanthranilate isomerase
LRVKICGLSQRSDIEAVNEAGADYIGFVFVGKSRRYISPEKAAELKKYLAPQIKAVGVFVNEELEVILSLLERDIIDIVQLHGQEEEAFIRKLKANTTKPIIKAISVEYQKDIQKWEQTAADYLLFDNGAGGSGEKFDWSMIPSINKPWFLAGGLHKDNVKEALQTGAFGLDVSSGVEIEGKKDKERIRELVTIVRSGKRDMEI